MRELTHSYSDIYEKDYLLRCLVVGAPNTGKRTLIKANCSCLDGKRDKMSKYSNIIFYNYFSTLMDLIVNTQICENTRTRYHFWIQTWKENYFGDLFKGKNFILKNKKVVYHKTASAFIFVYDVTSKASFQLLEQALEKITPHVDKEKFFGILVGNKMDMNNKREVSSEMATKLKSKYGIFHFIETNYDIESQSPSIIELLSMSLKMA
jgi:GTPase SAR1 family protein